MIEDSPARYFLVERLSSSRPIQLYYYLSYLFRLLYIKQYYLVVVFRVYYLHVTFEILRGVSIIWIKFAKLQIFPTYYFSSSVLLSLFGLFFLVFFFSFLFSFKISFVPHQQLVKTPDLHRKLHEYMDDNDEGWPNSLLFG